jgi:putative ABC transport system permease protein
MVQQTVTSGCRAKGQYMLQNLRFGWRQFKKSPAFSVTALLSLALGISASVTMFTAFRSVFLRSIPYRAADQIVDIEKIGQNGLTPAHTLADLEFFRMYAKTVQSFAGYAFFETATLTGTLDPADLWVRHVSAELFPLLGSRALIGRTFIASDYAKGAPATVVLSYNTWQKYFQGALTVLGRTIYLNQAGYVVVGVMPQGFYFPQQNISAWLPSTTAIGDPATTYTAIVGRLRPGGSIEQARSELDRLTPALLKVHPMAERNFYLRVERFTTRETEDYRAAFWLLLSASGFLALISCLNVASLLSSRAIARQGEFDIRRAMGARRRQLIAQLLTEGLLLGAASGVLGICLAYMANRLLLRLVPASLNIPRLEDARVDLYVLGFTVLLTLVVTISFGLAPALLLSSGTMSGSDRQARSSTRHSWTHRLLLMVEVAVALILLTGSVLMIRSFVRLTQVNPGFRAAHIFTAVVPPGHAARLSREALTKRYSEILRVAATVPGAEQAALTGFLPLGRIHIQLQVNRPGSSTTTPLQVDFHAVSAQYFEVMGIPLLAGRTFRSDDDPARDKGALVINRAMAQLYWPGQNAIGQRLAGRAGGTLDLTVIGIVGNTVGRSLKERPLPEFYESYRDYLGPAVGTTFVLRTYNDPASVAAALRQAIHKFDPEQVVTDERSLEAALDDSLAAPRFYTILLAIFAGLALFLGLVGVYGVASYAMSLRRREFGIRLALGAERRQLIGMLVREGLWQAMIGVTAGLTGALLLARFMTSLVFGISTRDPISFAAAGALLVAGAVAACYLPARRNTKLDPSRVLRSE